MTRPPDPGARGRSLVLFAPLLGRWPGHIPDVFETLGPLLEADKHEVVAVSSHRSRLRRTGQMIAVARRERPDVALVHLYSGRAALVEDLVSSIQRRRARRLIGLLAGGGFPHFERRHPRLTRRLLGRFDHLVAPSSYLTEWASTVVDVPMSVIPNPLDADRYPFQRRTSVRPHLLWMRAYHPVYDPITAVAVIDRLRVRFPDAHLTMAGPDKGMQSEVEAEVAKRRLECHVDVRGFVTGEEKADLLATRDVFLNTPTVDNRPVSVIEAAASGMCIVSTDPGGVPHLLANGVDALLTPVGDVEALSAAVDRLVADPSLASKLSGRGRRLAEAGAPMRVQALWSDLLR